MADEKYLSVTQMIESETDEKVIAEIELIKQPDVEYDSAILHVMGNPVGVFDKENKLKFQPSQFGKIECEVIFYKGDASVWEIEDELEINISTWYVGVHPDLGHQLQKIYNGGELELFHRQTARGNNDICFRMVVRVPAEESLTFGYAIRFEDDPRPKYRQGLKIHYRLADYKDRNDLYVPPDEAMYHVDIETGKWLESLTLEHGIHIIYIAPSQLHDLSFLQIIGIDFLRQARFSVSGFFKTIL